MLVLYANLQESGGRTWSRLTLEGRRAQRLATSHDAALAASSSVVPLPPVSHCCVLGGCARHVWGCGVWVLTDVFFLCVASP